MSKDDSAPFYDRELSWLQFNGRVLQESADSRNPLIERLRFLAIFSSNLDEFYRVRVASLRSLIRLGKKDRKGLEDFKPKKLLKEINARVEKQLQEFGAIYQEQIIPGLSAKGVKNLALEDLDQHHKQFLKQYFQNHLSGNITYHHLDPHHSSPFIANNQLYHFITLGKDENQLKKIILKIPNDIVGRFIKFPGENGEFEVVLIDEVIRYCLPQIFPGVPIHSCHSFKLTRDGDLYLEDEFASEIVDKIRMSLQKRKTGIPSRFLYDSAMPKKWRDELAQLLGLETDDLVAGGRFHNFSDFWDFPFPENKELTHPPQPPLSYAPFEEAQLLKQAILQRDHGLHFPYQSYHYVVRLIEEAAADPTVQAIKITLYRVAKHSKICQALIKAAQNNIEVIVFDEVQARFDEASNLYWGEQLEKAGAAVMYSHHGLKVHSKLCLIERLENGKATRQALLATGNFNEKTAGIYCDMGYFTARENITTEAQRVFELLKKPEEPLLFNTLLVAPHALRECFNALIDQEIELSRSGKSGQIFAKMNSLQDRKIIERLYEASEAGVEINLLVRGICCLVPGVPGFSENITVRSIVGRFLEHARIFIFGNSNEPLMYAASADWMTRNLNRRVEVGFPIYNSEIRKDINQMMHLQWHDNSKARDIDAQQTNLYCQGNPDEKVEAQRDFYRYLSTKNKS